MLSAQRFSASEIGSLPESQLNSIRADCAQRFSASEIGSQNILVIDCLLFDVLNAFQHRRSVREMLDETDFQLELCSTLFSIGDRFAATPYEETQDLRKCSTLFSIGDRFALRRIRTRPGIHRAQRFSASEIGSLDPNSPSVLALMVLNAFQHRRSVRKLRDEDAESFKIVLNAFQHRRSVRWISGA